MAFSRYSDFVSFFAAPDPWISLSFEMANRPHSLKSFQQILSEVIRNVRDSSNHYPKKEAEAVRNHHHDDCCKEQVLGNELPWSREIIVPVKERRRTSTEDSLKSGRAGLRTPPNRTFLTPEGCEQAYQDLTGWRSRSWVWYSSQAQLSRLSCQKGGHEFD